MKWKIIIEKFINNKSVVKEAIINIKASPQGVVERMKYYGWNVTYLVPVSAMVEDEDTILIETGR